jgi:hypothetical protein
MDPGEIAEQYRQGHKNIPTPASPAELGSGTRLLSTHCKSARQWGWVRAREMQLPTVTEVSSETRESSTQIFGAGRILCICLVPDFHWPRFFKTRKCRWR